MELTRVLRKTHNAIKSDLLKDACRIAGKERGAKVLDLGCGAGGDLLKYVACDVSYVLGVDVCQEAIDEARRRCKGLDLPKGMAVTFAALRDTYAELPFMIYPNTMDVVSCQFAIHFLADDPRFEELIVRVVRSMRAGGVFIGTVLEGDRVDRLVGDSDVYDSSLLRVERRGDRIGFRLKEKTRFFGEEASLERLLYPEDIIGAFLKAGLRLLYWKNFREMYDAQKYPKDLQTISDLYSAFAFQKK